MILLRDMIGNASIIELIWIVTAVSGMYLARLNGVEAWHDFNALGGKQNGRRRIAIGSIRREVVRGFVNACFLVVGVIAALNPANPNATVLGLVLALVLIMASVSYNVNSFLDRQDRIYLMRYGMSARDDKGRFTKD